MLRPPLFHTDIDELEPDSYCGLIDGVVVCTGATRDAVEAQLMLIVSELRDLPEHIYVLTYGYLALDHTLALSEAVKRAERAFAPVPHVRAVVCA